MGASAALLQGAGWCKQVERGSGRDTPLVEAAAACGRGGYGGVEVRKTAAVAVASGRGAEAAA